MTSPRKQVYTYTSVKDLIVQIVQRAYGYEVAGSLRYLEEYDTEGERPTILTSLYMDLNTGETDQIGLDMLYQPDITYYIKIIIEFEEKLRKSYTVIWDF